MFSIQVVIYANPINNINRFVLQELGILRRVSDCEELVWLLTRDYWLGFKDYINLLSTQSPMKTVWIFPRGLIG